MYEDYFILVPVTSESAADSESASEVDSDDD